VFRHLSERRGAAATIAILVVGVGCVRRQVPVVAPGVGVRLAAEHRRAGRCHVRVPRVGAGTPHVDHVARLAHITSDVTGRSGGGGGGVPLPQLKMA